jgi:hypothetical protein
VNICWFKTFPEEHFLQELLVDPVISLLKVQFEKDGRQLLGFNLMDDFMQS